MDKRSSLNAEILANEVIAAQELKTLLMGVRMRDSVRWRWERAPSQELAAATFTKKVLKIILRLLGEACESSTQPICLSLSFLLIFLRYDTEFPLV